LLKVMGETIAGGDWPVLIKKSRGKVTDKIKETSAYL